MNRYLKKTLDFIVKNVRSLILSLVLAIIIWFAVSIQVFPNVYDHVDGIEVTATPTAFMQEENLEIAGFDQTVSIQIQGKRYTIGTLTNEDFVATLDLSKVTTAGKHVVDIDVRLSDASLDCTITTTGLTATVNVKKIITREIEIETGVNNIVIADGLQIQSDDIVTEPATVTIKGEESIVNSISKAVVEAAYDGVMSETTEVKGTISLYKSDNTKVDNPDLELDNESFNVTVPVYKVKTLPLDISLNIPGNFDEESLKYTIIPSEITIAAPATDNSIDNLNKIDIGEISLNDITSKDLQGIRLTISLPSEYKNLSNVGIAQINFENVDSYGKLDFTVSSDNFTVLNGDSDYTYSIVTSQLSVSVVGPSDVLQNMTSSDISGTINLLGVAIEDGVKNVTINLRIAGANVTAWVTGDYKIDIRATKK